MEKEIKIEYQKLSKLVSPHKIKILKVLKKKKRLNLTQLQEELKITPSEIRRHTSKLINVGLVLPILARLTQEKKFQRS